MKLVSSQRVGKNILLMMRCLSLFILVLLPGFQAQSLAAQEARELTAESAFSLTIASKTLYRLTDRDWYTAWESGSRSRTLTIKSPEPVYSLYLCFAKVPGAYQVEALTDGRWESLQQPESEIAHQLVRLHGATVIRVTPSGKDQAWFSLAEIFVFGEGDLPSFVQEWQLPDDKADILLLHAHPDDESLYFGGLLPTYAGERRLDVVTAVLSPSFGNRRGELLNALWEMGVTNYPIFGPFSDKNVKTLDSAYKAYGKNTVRRYAVSLLRTYRPDVVVTHDVGGEYGHGMHQMSADMMLYAFDAASDTQRFPKEGKPWQVSKLYLHLYKENEIVLDWDIPLAAFDGKTGFEVAELGYSHHKSQHEYVRFHVEDRNSKYSSYAFGLAKSIVGSDVLKNDIMENLVSEP